MVDRSVRALIDCAECYLDQYDILIVLVSALMKLTRVDMTTLHSEIKVVMC